MVWTGGVFTSYEANKDQPLDTAVVSSHFSVWVGRQESDFDNGT